jgi:hypothetical protein
VPFGYKEHCLLKCAIGYKEHCLLKCAIGYKENCLRKCAIGYKEHCLLKCDFCSFHFQGKPFSLQLRGMRAISYPEETGSKFPQNSVDATSPHDITSRNTNILHFLANLTSLPHLLRFYDMEWQQICKRLSGKDSKEKVVAYFKDYPGICLEGEETQGGILGKKRNINAACQTGYTQKFL